MKIQHYLVSVAVILGIFCGGCRSSEHDEFRYLINEVGERMMPSVVYIQCIRSAMEQGKDEGNTVYGSGVIISGDGEILTNYHVIDKALSIRCLLYDGRSFNAVMVGGDKEIDLALLKLEMPLNSEALPVAKLAVEPARRGDFVIAMGAPWGFSRSISFGIISCESRALDNREDYSLWYQTDASISPGNSGGPLIDVDGNITGINTLGMFYGGTVGFSIPAPTIRDVLPRLREYGSVNWAWFGLNLQPLFDFERNIKFDFDSGVIVSGTESGSPARKAGFLPNDRIVAVDGQVVSCAIPEELPDLRRQLGLLPFDKEVAFGVIRDGAELEIKMAPVMKGKVEGDQFACPRWNFTGKNINRFDTPSLYYYRPEGVYVMGVNWQRSKGELAVNDVIMSIDGVEIKNLDDLKAAYDRALEGDKMRVTFVILRNGQTRHTVISLNDDLL